ncbi:MAG: hypothetical protein HP491_19095 [Nitrospira sp.]|nr:hypothetical protein [Nitrospira sp.]MBH0186888.1 hypothetical protein [Nitrospira sp.]
MANIISMLGHPYPAWGQLARVFVPHLTAAVKRNCSVSDNNPREQLNTDAEKLIQEYKQRFKDEPPYFLLQGQALLDAVKEALEKNRPIPFEVPDQGFA